MLSLIPPVGSRIRLDTSASTDFSRRSDVRLYASGTAALAAALHSVGRVAGTTRVAVPAYGCPALVAAALHAGMKPILIDLGADSPFPSKATLEASLSGERATVVHVNFLGLPPSAPSQGACEGNGAATYHIYDCCQGWPAGGACPDWAHAAVVSFGRGKPITLGNGGALLVNRMLNDLPTLAPESVRNPRSALGFRLRSALYNAVLDPRIFYWIDKVPGLHIGETRYQALESVMAMCDQARLHLDANIVAYEQSNVWTVGRVRDLIGNGPFGSFGLLTAFQDCSPDVRLLRLPMLAESKARRDTAVEQLRRAGFAATSMYRTPLWTFAGLEFLAPFKERCPNAADFADRLLTLPLHAGVSERVLKRLIARLASL
jgi:dTDP-4-amino-4,6-dideoxygalactose transaminase